MSTITKEWLQQKISDMEAARDDIPFSLDEDDSNTQAALRIALASLEAEPVAWIVHARTGDQLTTDGGYVANAEGILGLHSTPLYTSPPAPVVPEECPMELSDRIIDMCDGFVVGDNLAQAIWNACRDAMLNHSGDAADMVEPVRDREKWPATQFKPVADLYGITSPTGSETSFTFDAVEARDFIDGGWSCQEYVQLERFHEAVSGNSPEIPDGWVLVSERMPDVGDIVLTAIDGCVNVGEMERSGDNYRYFTSVISGRELPVTHWMPLPEPPQEVGDA